MRRARDDADQRAAAQHRPPNRQSRRWRRSNRYASRRPARAARPRRASPRAACQRSRGTPRSRCVARRWCIRRRRPGRHRRERPTPAAASKPHDRGIARDRDLAAVIERAAPVSARDADRNAAGHDAHAAPDAMAGSHDHPPCDRDAAADVAGMNADDVRAQRGGGAFDDRGGRARPAGSAPPPHTHIYRAHTRGLAVPAIVAPTPRKR